MTRPLAEASLQDLHEVKLLLRSESVIDWHRLYIDDESQARRLFQLCGLDVENEADQRRLEALRTEAANYITSCLKLRLDDYVSNHAPVESLPMLASKEGKHQRNACTLLKVMHIIHHLNARELRTVLPIPDSELFAEVESSVVLMFDELRAAGVPVVEFSWSRKTRESQVTKLLVKRETSAARIFDRLRFRVIVENREDLGPTLHVMLHRCIPFNYVAPGQTVNNLVETAQLASISTSEPEEDREVDPTETNEFSSQQFRVLNFIADLP
ncbi:MAG: TIGR04552 family protein, partial [Nannocystaceae bacterium]